MNYEDVINNEHIGQKRWSRRSLLRGLLGFSAAIAPAAAVGTASEKQLRVRYVQRETLNEGIIIEHKISENLDVSFLPLEHRFGKSNGNYSETDWETVKALLQQQLQDANAELWIEALPWEIDGLPDLFPKELKFYSETIKKFAQGIGDFYEAVLTLAKYARADNGFSQLTVYCPEIVNGSSLYPLVLDKPGGLLNVLSFLGPFFLPRMTIFQLREMFNVSTNEKKLTRRNLLKLLVRSCLLGIMPMPTLSNIEHQRQIYRNKPVSGHTTEDTIREAWQAFALMKYAERLRVEGRTAHIVFVNTPPHIEGILMRLSNAELLNDEMRVNQTLFPDEIFKKGLRRYLVDLSSQVLGNPTFVNLLDDSNLT